MTRIFLLMVAGLWHYHILAQIFMTLSYIGNHVGVLKVEKATRLSHQAVREERVPDRTEKHSEQVREVGEPSRARVSGDDCGVLEDTRLCLLEIDVRRDIETNDAVMVNAEHCHKAYELKDVSAIKLTMPAYTIKMKVYQRSPKACSLSSFFMTFTTMDSTPMDTM